MRNGKVRQPLQVAGKAQVLRPNFKTNCAFQIDSKSVDWSHVAAVPHVQEIIGAAVAAAANRTNKIAFLNDGPRQLLEFLAKNKLALEQESILSFRAAVEEEKGPGANSKYQKFLNVRSILKELFARKAVAAFELPPNLPREEPRHKQSLISMHPARPDDVNEELRKYCAGIKFKNSVSDDLKLSVGLGIIRLELLADFAMREIESNLEETRFAQSAIDSHDIAALRNSEYLSGQSLEYCLAWLFANHGRILPRTDTLPSRVQGDIKRRFGGSRQLQRKLAPTSDWLSPFIALFLANGDCAPNVDGIRSYTYIDSVKAGSSGQSKILQFEKVRGGKRLFEIELNSTSTFSLPNSLERLSEFVQRCIADGVNCSPDIVLNGRTKLFLHVDRQKTRTLTCLDPGTFNDAVRRFLGRAAQWDARLKPISSASSENFRPTHATIETLISGLLSASNVLGHENLETSVGYISRNITAATTETRIERFHSYLLEQAQSVGKDKLADARPTGLGTFCGKSHAGDSLVCTRISVCEKEECAEAIVVLEDPGTTAIWMRMADHIEEQSEYLKKNYPDRWNEVWLPKLTFYKVLLSKTSAKTKLAAQKLALVSKSVGFPMPPLS